MPGNTGTENTLLEKIVLAAAVAGTLLLLLWITDFSARPLSINDLFWQVRTGEMILDTGAIPDSDPFSYTNPGAAWNNHEWGFELLAALLQRFAGWGGVRIAMAAYLLAFTVCLTVVVGRRTGAPFAFLILVLFWVMGWYKMSPLPQGLSMGLFLAALYFFRGTALALSPRRWAGLTILMLVWGNLTAECLMFLPFVVLDQILLRYSRDGNGIPGFPDVRRHVLLLGLVCVAPLVNPPQSSVLDYALAGTRVNRQFNVEFAPIWAPAYTIDQYGKDVAQVLILVYLVWAAVALHRAPDRWRTMRRVGPGLLAVGGAVAFERNLWLLLLPAAQIAASLTAWAADSRRRLPIDAGAVALGAALFVASAAIYSWTPLVSVRHFSSPDVRKHHLDAGLVPLECVDPLEQVPALTRVYALRMWASYIVWRLPYVRVFIDGRNREYPDAIHRQADEVFLGGTGALAILDDSRTDAVIATPGWGDQPGIRGGPWRAVVRGTNCELYVRAVRR